MGVLYEKDGIKYMCGPKDYLNTSPKGENRGDKLQEFFDNNDIHIDLGSGTGSMKGNLFYVSRDRYGHAEDVKQIFANTDFREEKMTSLNNTNQNANDNLRHSFHKDILNSTLLFRRPQEQYPRIIYLDNNGDVKLSAPINELNTEQLRPKKPNLFKRMLHALNNNWFREDFDVHYRRTESFNRFTREIEKIKTDSRNRIVAVEQINAEFEKEKEVLTTAQMIKDSEVAFEKRTQQILGVKPEHNKYLVEKNVFKSDVQLPGELEYPQGTPFSKRDIAIIGFAAISDPKVSDVNEFNKYLSADENTQKKFVHLTHDIFFKGFEREGSGTRFVNSFAAARNVAKENIEKFAQGDKEPLAKMLGHAIKFQLKNENGFDQYTHLTASTAIVTSKLMGILKKDPELLEKSGLTEEDLTSYKAHQEMARIFTQGAKSQELLQKAGKGEINISEAQKEEALLDVITSKVLVGIENNDIKNYPKTNQEKSDELQMEAGRLIVASGLTKQRLKDMAPNDPQRAATELQVKDEELQAEAVTVKLAQFSNERPDSPTMKMLGNDDEKHTLLNDLKKRISNTEKFKEYANKTVEEIREAQSSSNGPTRITADSDIILKDITEKQVIEDEANLNKDVKVEEIVNEKIIENVEEVAEKVVEGPVLQGL